MNKKRKSIPNKIKLQVWTEAGGRCQFKGCNKPLWYNGLTLSKGNFSELAHIIGAKKKGPRGNINSDILQDKSENIMLLCQECHKEIDDLQNIKKYSTDLLKKWKKEHEERIRIQTSIHAERYKTTILRFQYNIGDQQVIIGDEETYNAIKPMYPSDRKGIIIEKQNFDRTKDIDYWTMVANEIGNDVKRKLELGIDGEQIKHLSIFALGAMPLLMYLGKTLSDIMPMNIFHHNRNIRDSVKSWTWNNTSDKTIEFIINQKKTTNSNKVALILALSDNIGEDKFNSAIADDFNIYEFTIKMPSPHCIENKTQLEIYSYEIRKLFNKIQNKHGVNCEIHIFPATPAVIAIQTGRLLLPTKEGKIFIYEYIPKTGFRKVLQLN